MRALTRLGRAALGAALLAPLLVAGAAPAVAAPVDPPAPITPALAGAASAQSVLVGVSPTAGVVTQNAIARSAGADQVARVAPSVLQLAYKPGSVHASAAQLEARSDVRYVQPNTAIHSSRTPNDPGYPPNPVVATGQWDLFDGAPGIGAPTAWSRTTGSTSVVVGVLDSGIDLFHPDLHANLWTNPGGIGGCPAGTYGIDVVDTKHPNCTPQDQNGHGTHVAGTIGAVGNNGEGVTGINWTTRMMALRVLDDQGSGSVASAVSGIEFAVQAKAAGVDVRVLNASWGDDGTSGVPLSLRDEIVRAGAYGILFVAAAGNTSTNLDTAPQYPCSLSLPNEICVAATTNSPTDTLATFSNYGPNTVDLAAPGVDITSTFWDPKDGSTYATASGTSMAAPHVAGAAALMLSSQCMSTAALKATLLANVQPVAALSGLVGTGGRLDLGRAVGPSRGGWCAFDTAPPLSGGLTSGAAVSSWAPGRTDVFARNSAGHLAHSFSAGTYRGWEDLGGGIQGTPAAVSWSNGRIDVFARGTDNQLWHKAFAGGRWIGWEPLGGSLSSGPAAASWSAGRLDVFARGTDGQLWHKWYNGAWSGWEPLGGGLGGDPAATSWSVGRLDIAARGTDGQVWHKWYAGGWSGWEPLGGAAVGGTGLSTRRPGVLDIFVTGTDGHLWHKWFDGAWHGYENLGGTLASGPNAVSWSSSRIDVVARSGTDLAYTYWEP